LIEDFSDVPEIKVRRPRLSNWYQSIRNPPPEEKKVNRENLPGEAVSLLT